MTCPWDRLSPLAAKVRWGGRLVVKDLLDLIQDLWRELGQELQGLAVLGNLLGLGGTEDDSADILVLDAPGDAERRDGAAQALGDVCKLAYLGDLLLALLFLECLDSALKE